MEDDVPGPAGPRAPARQGEQLPLEAGTGFRLSRLTRGLRAQWAQELAVVCLTPPQAALLRAIAGQPGLSLRALARTLGTEPMRAKRCADALETAGLLHSAHRGDDRRPRRLTLSPKGLELADRVEILVRRQEARIDQVLGQELRPGLEKALAALEGLLHADNQGTAPTVEGAGRSTGNGAAGGDGAAGGAGGQAARARGRAPSLRASL